VTDQREPQSPLDLVAPLAVDEGLNADGSRHDELYSPGGVAVFATQSAGCEGAEYLGGLPFVLYHGDSDRILPCQSSQMVQMLAGYGDVRILPGADHLLVESADEIRSHVYPWVSESFAAHAGQEA